MATFSQDLFSKTTVRERQIVALLAQGYRAKEIAQELHISQDTVENHRSNIIRKTGLKTSPAIVAEFQRAGLIIWENGNWTHALSLFA